MRTRKGRLILLTIAIIAIILAGCSGEGNDIKPSGTSDLNATGTPKATVTPRPTVGETASPEPTREPLATDKLGKPQNDSTIIFEDNFADNLPHESVLFRFNDGHEIVNEQLYLSIKNGVPVQLADTYSPDLYCEVEDDINQIEYFITFKTEHPDAKIEKNYFMAAFIGVRVYEPMGGVYRPNDEDSGIYIAFTQHNYAVLYHGNHTATGKTWELGVVGFELPVGFADFQTLAIVDTGDKLFYYIVEGDNYTLFLTIDVSGDKIKAYNSSDELIYEADNNMKGNPGGYFKIFNHFGRTVVDSVVIKER